MKVSKLFSFIVISCAFLAITSCEDEEGPLGPGEVIGQPQDIDLDEIKDFLKDNNLNKEDALSKNPEKIRSTVSLSEDGALVFNYGEMILVGIQELVMPDISKETIDNSILLAYYTPTDEEETAWQQMPGISSSGLFKIITYFYQRGSDYSFIIKTISASGVSSQAGIAVRGVKILVTPKDYNSINLLV